MNDIGVYLIGFALFAAGWMARGLVVSHTTRKVVRAVRDAGITGKTGEIYRDRDVVVRIDEVK